MKLRDNETSHKKGYKSGWECEETTLSAGRIVSMSLFQLKHKTNCIFLSVTACWNVPKCICFYVSVCLISWYILSCMYLWMFLNVSSAMYLTARSTRIYYLACIFWVHMHLFYLWIHLVYIKIIRKYIRRLGSGSSHSQSSIFNSDTADCRLSSFNSFNWQARSTG